MIYLNQLETNLRQSKNYLTSCDITSVCFDDGTPLYIFINGVLVDGYFEFYGAEEWVRAYMEKNGLSVVKVVVLYIKRWGVDSAELFSTKLDAVLYTSAKLLTASYFSAKFILEKRFLATRNYAVLFPGATFWLYYYNTVLDMTCTFTYTQRDGSIRTEQMNVGAGGVGFFVVNYHADASMLQINMGIRKFIFYFVEAKSVQHFVFRNLFNVLESISLPCTVSTSLDTEYDTAQQNRLSVRYDISHHTTFSLTTAPIPMRMYEHLLALCRARYVEVKFSFQSGGVLIPGWTEIIIKDYQLERSDAPDTPLILKMDYEYADADMNNAFVIE